jgi:hypothetical protein
MFDVHLLKKTGKAKMYPVNVYETTGTYGGKTLGIDGRGVIGKLRMLSVASGFSKHYKQTIGRLML